MKCFLMNARADPHPVSSYELCDKIKVSWLSKMLINAYLCF